MAEQGSAHTPTFLRELYSPTTGPSVDIVFVHGLNPFNTSQFAEKTWTHVNGTFWPKDILPKNVPNCRILLFGYNSNVAFDVSHQGIKEHADTLLNRLTGKRKATEELKTRPIIFVGHSLGGLVIKQALINATNNSQVYGLIKEATRGLVFFGTPHQGGNGVSFGQVATNIITAVSGRDRNDILKSLSADSILTKNANDDFRHQFQNYRVVTFYETRKTKIKRLKIFGFILNSIVVSADSAKLGLGGSLENQLAIDADHSGICKFGSADDRYEPVGDQIEELVKHVIQEEKKRVPIRSEVNESKRLNLRGHLGVKRSLNFSGREHEILEIHRHLSKPSPSLPQKAVVLYGLGGIGKTEISLAYTSKYRDEYTAVFWVDATDRQTAMLGFLQIAQGLIDSNASQENSTVDYAAISRRLHLPGLISTDGLLNCGQSEEATGRVIKAVKMWLDMEENRNFLIVFDNYDDIESYDLVSNFFPETGNILVTSRRKEAAFGYVTPIEIEGILEEDGVQLLLRTSQTPECSKAENLEEVKRIVNHLERLPLAIEIAGSYIRHRGISFSQFLSTLKDHQTQILTEIPPGALRRYDPDAARLLQFCAFLHYGEISLEFLKRGSIQIPSNSEPHEADTHLQWLQTLVLDNFRFQKAAAALFSYSLAHSQSGTGLQNEETDIVFSIHPLVHFWSREKLKTEEKAQYTLSSLFLLDQALLLPDTTAGHIAKRNALPHLETCLGNLHFVASVQEIAPNNREPGAFVRLAWILLKQGRYPEAGTLYQRSLTGNEKLHGPDHPNTLGTVHGLAILYSNQGRYPEAETLYQRALTGNEKLHGLDHPDTLGTVHNLANLYSNQGRYPEAETLYQRALTGNERLHGPDHPDTLRTVHGLANLYSDQGRYPEAETLRKKFNLDAYNINRSLVTRKDGSR